MNHGGVAGLAARAARVVLGPWTLPARIDRLEERQDTIWDYLVERAKVEFLNKGMGTFQSPPVASAVTRSWFAPIAAELRAVYRSKGDGLPPNELFILLHRQFGPWITANVCVPQGLAEGACLIAAIAVAMEEEKAEAPETSPGPEPEPEPELYYRPDARPSG